MNSEAHLLGEDSKAKKNTENKQPPQTLNNASLPFFLWCPYFTQDSEQNLKPKLNRL